MFNYITIRCDRCGNEALDRRKAEDPRNASVLCTDYCPKCEKLQDCPKVQRYEDDAGEVIS